MRATALGYAVDYASAIAEDGPSMAAAEIVEMADVFLSFLAHSAPDAAPATAAADMPQEDDATAEPVQPEQSQSAPTEAPAVETPPPAPPAPPDAPVPEQPAPAIDQPGA